MSDTTPAAAVLAGEVRTADLLLPAPRRSPETVSSGQVAVGGAADQPDFPYPPVRYAMERLEALCLL